MALDRALCGGGGPQTSPEHDGEPQRQAGNNGPGETDEIHGSHLVSPFQQRHQRQGTKVQAHRHTKRGPGPLPANSSGMAAEYVKAHDLDAKQKEKSGHDKPAHREIGQTCQASFRVGIATDAAVRFELEVSPFMGGKLNQDLAQSHFREYLQRDQAHEGIMEALHLWGEECRDQHQGDQPRSHGPDSRQKAERHRPIQPRKVKRPAPQGRNRLKGNQVNH